MTAERDSLEVLVGGLATPELVSFCDGLADQWTVTGPVETCVECAALFEDRDFDCVLLEPELSDGTSFAFARHLHDSEQPFAFLTARTDIVQEAGFPHAAAFAMEEGATPLAQWLEGRE